MICLMEFEWSIQSSTDRSMRIVKEKNIQKKKQKKIICANEVNLIDRFMN